MKKILIILLYSAPLLWSALFVMLSVSCLAADRVEAPAQSPRIDSMYKQLDLHSGNNMEQLNLLLATAEAEELSNPDKGIGVANKAIELAKKLNKEPELAAALNQKARLLIMKQLTDDANKTLTESVILNQKLNNKNQLAENDLTTAQFIFCQRKSDTTLKYINKSYEHFKNLGNDFVLGKIYLFYGAHYGFLNTDTAQMFYLKAKACFEKCDRKDWLAYVNFFLATNFTSLNKNDEALAYFKIAANLNKEVRSDLIAENIYCTTGYLYFSLGDYPKAVSNFIPGLKIAERINDEMMQACLLGNLGSVFGSMKDYKKSGEFIDKQIAIAKKIGDDFTLCFAFQNLGWIQYDHQNYNEALKYFKIALELSLKIKQFDSMAESYGNLGDVYEKLRNYNEAFISLQKALELNRLQGNYANISDNLLALSRTILNSGNSKLNDAAGGSFDVFSKREKAIEFSIEALKIAEDKSTLTLKRDALKQLSDLYGLTGDEKKAFDFYKKYIAAKDSIMSSENIKSINNLQLKFETEKKEQQIALLNTDQKIQEKEISKKKTERNGFIAGCFLLMMIGGVAYNRYQLKQKTNKELSDALAQLKQVQQKLIEQEKLASLGQLTAGIAHEIQNPLNFVINFSELSRELFDDLNDDNIEIRNEAVKDLEDNLSKIEKHGLRADGIIQSMLQHSKSGNVKCQSTNLNLLCKEALAFSLQSIAMGNPDFKCRQQINFDEKLPEVSIVSQDILSVIINLMSNAFYAMNEKKQNSQTASDYEPEIIVQTFFIDGKVHLKVTDNGNGIPQEVKSKIFQPFFTTKPTHLGTGLGLSISYDIIKAHEGNLAVESTSQNGTVFVLSLPV